MKSIRSVLALVALLAVSGVASANKYVDTIALVKKSGESADFFSTAYGYAGFPTIGKGGFVVGGAHGASQAIFLLRGVVEQALGIGDVFVRHHEQLAIAARQWRRAHEEPYRCLRGPVFQFEQIGIAADQ